MFDGKFEMLTENCLWVMRGLNMYQKGLNKVMLV